MRIVVTGAAGFVGSHLTEELVHQGHEVVAVDCLLPDLYSAEVKARTLSELAALPSVTTHVSDLRTAELDPIIEGADAVVNEAAMPGLVKSWSDFPLYASCNLLAVDRLIQACQRQQVGRFVQISTSSVYGRFAVGDESSPTEPFSPYGVSKLAAEKLVLAHVANFGFPAMILRYFSLYGPRQRPDMAYHRFCEALLDGREITIFGDGRQTRTNTYISDAVAATVAAVNSVEIGEVMNIAGSSSIALLDAVGVLADELNVSPQVVFDSPRAGDQRETRGVTDRASQVLGWRAEVPVEQGLRRQARWHAERRLTNASGLPPRTL